MNTIAGRPRVVVCDDELLIRMWLEEHLREAGYDSESVPDGQSLLAAVQREPADLVLLDLRLPDGSGIDVCRDVRSIDPSIRALILTSYEDDEALFASIMAGAAGFVLKQVRGGDLVTSIKAVAEGRSLLDPAVTGAVLERLRKGKHLMRDEKLQRLSPQEERILTLVAEGKTNKEIGADLQLAEKTVKNYVSNLLMKMGMERRTEAAVYAARLAERRRQRGDDDATG